MRFRIYLFSLIFLLHGCSILRPAVPPPAKPAPGFIPRALRAEATVEFKRGMPLRGKALIIAKAPDSFRIEVLGPFRSTMALLVSDGETLYVFSGAEEKEYRWKDPDFPYPFRAEDVVSSLLGAASRDLSNGDYIYSADKDGHIEKVVKLKDGEPVLTVEMSDYRVVSGARLPFAISIEDKKGALLINYSTVEIDPVIKPGSFAVNRLFQSR